MTIDPLLRFSSRADAYAAARPHYPQDLAKLLRDACGLAAGATLVDAGSGTGRLTRLLLDAGYRVLAVEPNAPMRARAEAELAGNPGFTSIDGTAQATGLPAGSVDAVAAGQAFHWFDPVLVRDEWERIVRPGGWAILVWNLRRIDASPFMRAYDGLVRRYATDAKLAQAERTDAEAMSVLFRGRPYEVRRLEYLHPMDRGRLHGRVLSSSFMPSEGEPGHEEMLAAADQLFDAHAQDGRVLFEYDTPVHFGRLGAR